MNQEAFRIASNRGHRTVTNYLQVVESTRLLAREGRSDHFRSLVAKGFLPAPLAQWVFVMPPAARAELFSWVNAATIDSTNCYLILFSFCAVAATATPPASDLALWRRTIANDGVPGVRRLIVSFLVPDNASTRRILREMSAFGDLGAASASVDSDALLAAAAARAVAARRAWTRRELYRVTDGRA